MPTVYDWSPLFGAIDNAANQWGQRNQVNNIIDALSGKPANPNTGFPAQDQRMMAATQGPNALAGVNPQMLQMLRTAPPQVSLPLLLQLGTKQPEYGPTEYDQTGKAFVRDKNTATIKYLDGISARPEIGVADGVAYDKHGIKPGEQIGIPKAPQTREVNIGDKVVTEQWDGQKFVKIAEAPRYKPASAVDTRESWGQPVTEAGPGGKPIVVRYSNTGGRQIVEGATPKPTNRALSPRIIDSVVSAGTALDTMTRLNSSFKDEYGGNLITGGLENLYLRNKPGGDPSGQAQWWQDYQAYVNQVRNDLFGAALTPVEKAEFEKSIITERMSPEEARKNLQRQLMLSARAAQRKASPYVTGGYDKASIEDALGYTMEDIAKMNAPEADADAPKFEEGKVYVDAKGNKAKYVNGQWVAQ